MTRLRTLAAMTVALGLGLLFAGVMLVIGEPVPAGIAFAGVGVALVVFGLFGVDVE